MQGHLAQAFTPVESYRPELLKIINEKAKNRGGWPIRHNAMPDHVHLLVRLPPTVKVSDFIGQLKGTRVPRPACLPVPADATNHTG